MKLKKHAWNFWDDGITQGFLRDFMMCREQTRLKYVMGWRSIFPEMPLEFGNVCHHICEIAYRQKKVPTEQMIDHWLKAYRETWKVWTSRSTSDFENRELCIGLAAVIMKEYFFHWKKEDFGKRTKWIFTEDLFRVPYVYRDGKRTWIRGKIDGVYRNSENEDWLFDTKTKGHIDEDVLVSILPFDLQMLTYLWALKQMKFKPAGCRYNIIRRPQPRNIQDLHKKLKDLTKEVKKRPQHYFVRINMPITMGEIQEFEDRQLNPLMLEVRYWVERGCSGHPLNDQALFWGFKKSPYFNLITTGDTTHLRKAFAPFEELADNHERTSI